MDIEARLIVLHIDFEKSIQQLLLDGEKLPSCGIYSEINKTLQDLTKGYLTIDPEWVNYILVDVMIEKDVLILYYTCLVPAMLKNLQGKWVNIGELQDEHIQKMVFEAGHKVIARQ